MSQCAISNVMYIYEMSVRIPFFRMKDIAGTAVRAIRAVRAIGHVLFDLLHSGSTLTVKHISQNFSVHLYFITKLLKY